MIQENRQHDTDGYLSGVSSMDRVAENPMMIPRLTYGLFAIAMVTGIPMVIGLIVAYVVRGQAPAWLRTHYDFLIATFWYGLVLIGVGVLTWVFAVGMFLLWILPLWYVVRIVRGWMWLENQQPVPDAKSWLFS